MASASAGYSSDSPATAAHSVESVGKLQQDLGKKQLFCKACSSLASACEEAEGQPENFSQALIEAAKRAFVVLQSRFSNPKYWQAGLEFFLAIEFHVPSAATEAAEWRERAMEEVDEDAREQAAKDKQRRLLEWQKKSKSGQFSEAVAGISPQEMLMREMMHHGVILVEDTKPGLSRDALHELRLVTLEVDQTCPICQEIMPAGTKAKTMPCGHRFHDDCLVSWVSKNNSCPMCRYDELPSEKHHFDDVSDRIQKAAPHKSIFS